MTIQSGTLQVWDGIVGRERHCSVLHEAFRWAALGSTEMVLIYGSAGVGKSSLVLDAFRPSVAGRCMFAWAKLDPYTKKKPYEPLIRCFQFLTRQLLTKPEAELEEWKTRLRKAVGQGGSFITEAIPEAKLLLGELPQAEPLPAKEAHNRFERIFRRFVRGFARSQYPLVLFLDDLQWADRTTLQLLQSLASDPENQNLCVIGAFREQDWQENTDIREALLGRQPSAVSVCYIPVEPLEFASVSQLVAQTLDCEPAYSLQLAQELYGKSLGNPFYLKQLLLSAADERLLWLDPDEARWRWDIGKVRGLPHIAGEAAYLAERINRLPAQSRQLLLYAACLGGRFDTELLMAVSGQSREQLGAHLAHALQAGLLATGDHASCGAYYFTHDSIHQTAFSMLAPEARSRVYLRAGLYCLDRYEREQAGHLLFDMTNFLNQAEELLSAEQRETVALLNEQSAEKAKESADYEMALRYYKRAIGYLPDDCWHTRQAQAFRLHLCASECEYLCGYDEAAEQRVDAVLERAQDWMQRAQAVKLKVEQYGSNGSFGQAIALGLEELRALGVRIDVQPTVLAVKKEMFLARRLLLKHRHELHALPEVRDEQIRLMMDLFIALIGPAFFSNKDVLALISAKLIRLMFRYGAPQAAPVVYAAFGMALTTMTGDLQAGYAVGQCAMELAESSGAAWIKAKVYVMHHAIIAPWIEAGGVDKLWEASALGLESGDYLFGSYAIGGVINLTYDRRSIPHMHHVMRQCLPVAEQTQEELVYQNVLLYKQLAETWQASSAPDFTLTAGRASEAEFLSELTSTAIGSVTLYQLYTYKTQMHYLFGNYEQAIASAQAAEPYGSNAVGFPHLPIKHFYEGMAIAAAARLSPRGQHKQLKKRLKAIRSKFDRWVRISADIFKTRQLLLQAESTRGGGADSEVIGLYDEAIRLARDAKDAQYWAVASECAAAYHMDKGRTRLAESYLAEAYEAYRLWGAESKLESMSRTHPLLFRREPETASRHTAAASIGWEQTASGAADSAADGDMWRRVVKDAFTLSEHMDYDAVRKKLAAHIAQLSAADHVCLLMLKDNDLWVEPLTVSTKIAVQAEPHQLECSDIVAKTLVRFIWRSGEPVQLANAALDELFGGDPYIRRHHTGAVSGLPVYAHDKLTGILYMEFPSSGGPLQAERVDMLSTLAAQTLFVSKLAETFGKPAEFGEEDEPVFAEAAAAPGKPDGGLGADALTEREFEVLNLMSAGLTNKEIAVRLGVTAGTIKVHVHNIFSKLRVNRRTKAVTEAIKMNLLEPRDAGHG